MSNNVIVLDCGSSKVYGGIAGEEAPFVFFQVLPVYCCYVDEKSMRRINFGSGNVVDHMIRILRGRNRFLEKDRKMVEEIIHKVGYVALEYEEKVQPNEKYDVYELPDGQVLNLSQECFECNEILFNPGMAQYEFPGIVDLIDSLNSVEIDTRHQLYDQIVISGGLSKTRGLADRIQHDLKKVTPDSNCLRVIAQLNREYAAWTGGSILGYVQAFSKIITLIQKIND